MLLPISILEAVAVVQGITRSCRCPATGMIYTSVANNYKTKVEPNVSVGRLSCDSKPVNKLETASDLPKTVVHHNTKLNQSDHARDNCGRSRSKISSYSNFTRDPFHKKKVWEPVEPQKKYPRGNSDSDITLRSCGVKAEGPEPVLSKGEVCSNGVGRKPLGESGNSHHGGVGKQSNLNQNEKDARSSDYSEEASLEEVDSCLTDGGTFNGRSDFSPSSSSSSDNCSSCNSSEGDSSITASLNPQILDSSSTSDSEEASQRVEERNPSVSSRNGSSGDHVVETQKALKASGEDTLSKVVLPDLSSGCSGGNGSDPLWKSTTTKPLAQRVENDKIAPSMGSLHQGVIHHHEVQFPVFQVPPTLGFYHQNPASWSAAPTNAFIPYPHSNQYLFASPLGYGLTGDSHLCIQYGAMQPMTSPLLNPGQIPAYQPVHGANGFCKSGERNIYKPSRGIDPSVEQRRKELGLGHHRPTEIPLSRDAQNVKSSNLQAGTTGFSLFQFGGPVALSTYQSSAHASNEGLSGDISLNYNADHDEDDRCSKKETMIEEYNLFAASNGIKFSIL
ncbi:hypothetical protein Dimus_001873 [Dionaea muscipula]